MHAWLCENPIGVDALTWKSLPTPEPKAGEVRIRIEAVSLDSTSIKVHPDGTGALKKTALNPSGSPEADGTPRFIWLPRMLERP